jgi:hypothetical protein
VQLEWDKLPVRAQVVSSYDNPITLFLNFLEAVGVAELTTAVSAGLDSDRGHQNLNENPFWAERKY